MNTRGSQQICLPTDEEKYHAIRDDAMQGKEYFDWKHDFFVNDAYNREVVNITRNYIKLLQSQQAIDH